MRGWEKCHSELIAWSLTNSFVQLASVWRMAGKIWRHMGRIVKKTGCACLERKIQMVKAVRVERKRRKQAIVDDHWNLKVANFMY